MVNSLRVPRQEPVSPSVTWGDAHCFGCGELHPRWTEGPQAASGKVAVFRRHRGPRLQGVLPVATVQTGQMLPAKAKRALFSHSSLRKAAQAPSVCTNSGSLKNTLLFLNFKMFKNIDFYELVQRQINKTYFIHHDLKKRQLTVNPLLE